MRGRTRGGAPRAHASRRAASLVVAASVPALMVAQAVVATAGPASAAVTSLSAAQQAMSPALAAQLSQNVSKHVIVIMKNQLPAAHVGSAAARWRRTRR